MTAFVPGFWFGRAVLAGPQIDSRSQEIMVREPTRNKKETGNVELRKARLEEAKRDVATLADLAESLKKDLAQANEAVVPVSTLDKAEQIEQLAKKIRKWAKWN